MFAYGTKHPHYLYFNQRWSFEAEILKVKWVKWIYLKRKLLLRRAKRICAPFLTLKKIFEKLYYINAMRVIPGHLFKTCLVRFNDLKNKKDYLCLFFKWLISLISHVILKTGNYFCISWFAILPPHYRRETERQTQCLIASKKNTGDMYYETIGKCQKYR